MGERMPISAANIYVDVKSSYTAWGLIHVYLRPSVLLTCERNRWTASRSSNGTWKPLLRHGWMASESGGVRRVSIVAARLTVVSVSLGWTKSASPAAT
ncbi:hypothetical protein BHM03_00026222 [Ensete ventricosum]|nr:hypothetical protein BHM03_00026222 [Ensete ventricosum]